MDPNWTMKCCNVCNDKWKAPDPTRHQLGSYVHQNMGEELGNYVHQNIQLISGRS